jgi:hypothetical protein
MARKFQRRIYENTLLVAARRMRVLTMFWARRCRKSTNLGSIAFDEMSREAGRSVISASASLLLGKELIGMTMTAAEQASLVASEAAAVRRVFERESAEAQLDFQVANAATGKVYANAGLTVEDFNDLYRSSSLEMRLYFDRTTYSREKVIAPNPATARGWAGTVLRDEAGYTPAGLENDLRVATQPIMDTDPTFKLIYASNLCPDDRHPFFEMTLPPPDVDLPVNPAGNFYRGQTGVMIHRVTLRDAYAAGHVLFDERGKPLTYDEFCAQPGNKLGRKINYDLEHEMGGSAAVDLLALLTSQQRGADWLHALDLLRDLLGSGPVGFGFDVATTTGEKSNPSSLTITERRGTERVQRLVAIWKERKEAIARERLRDVVMAVRQRKTGGPARRLCVDATNEKYFAEGTRAALASIIPVQLVVASESVDPLPSGYEKSTNYKSYTGDLYCAAINENRYSMPSAAYIKADHRLVMKNAGRYECEPDNDGRHGDTFDSGKLAEFALSVEGCGISTLEDVAKIHLGGNPSSRPTFTPRRLTRV